MAEQSKRTKLLFGGVSAAVALVKMSGKPSEAQHDVRWPEDPLADKHQKEADDLAVAHTAERVAAGVDDDPLGGRGTEDGPGMFERPPSLESIAADPEPPKPRHGVQLGDGTFVDLTDRLAEIDERCKLDGVEVVACVPSASVPRERVRDASWIGSGDPGAAKVLALLWYSLHASGRVALVRWTKSKNQAEGVIVPRVAGRRRALSLLELEWSENMREPSPRITDPIDAEFSPGELAAAVRLVESYSAGPAAVDELRDERLALRAELLNAARLGGAEAAESIDVPPEREEAEAVEDVAERWAAAADRRAGLAARDQP